MGFLIVGSLSFVGAVISALYATKKKNEGDRKKGDLAAIMVVTFFFTGAANFISYLSYLEN